MAEQKANTGSENAVGWFILGCVFVALFFFFWYFNEYRVKSAIRWARWGEMWVLSWVLDDDYMVQWQGQNVNFDTWLEGIPKLDAKSLDNQTMSVIATLAIEPIKTPLSVLLGGMALWCMFYGPGTQNRRKMTLDMLIKTQAKVFPVISPFVKFNPTTQPPRPPGAPVPVDLPAFAEALGPEEWLAYHSIPVPDGKIDRQATYVAFARQLGPRWQGWEKLPAYKQVMLAAFCLQAARKRKDAENMVSELARCWSHEKGLRLNSKLISQARSTLRDKDISGPTLRKAAQHAFHTTAILRALATAREEGGVIAPAQFVWLRAYDRTLWYPLNNLGRQAFHMEAFGAMAHYKAEKMTQRPIPRPKVETAIDSIISYMNSEKARPIPQLDYKNSKRRGIKKPKAA
ncbi:MAG TPA: type IV secretion system protein [Micavibrio sp.]